MRTYWNPFLALSLFTWPIATIMQGLSSKERCVTSMSSQTWPKVLFPRLLSVKRKKYVTVCMYDEKYVTICMDGPFSMNSILDLEEGGKGGKSKQPLTHFIHLLSSSLTTCWAREHVDINIAEASSSCICNCLDCIYVWLTCKYREHNFSIIKYT